MQLKYLFFLLFLLSSTVYATTRTAATCNQTDVLAQVNLAVNGDTVIIPNGTCTWNAGITTIKQIKIQGQIKGSVKLLMGSTITGQGSALLNVTTGNSFSTEISNLQFWPTTTACATSGGAGCGTGQYIIVNGAATDKPILIHDNYFNVPDFVIFNAMSVLRYGGGVIWNNTFESITNYNCLTTPTSNLGCGSQSGDIQIKDGGGAATSWSTAPTMGAADIAGLNNIYIENNTFTNVGQTPDCDDGARVVIRHNTYNDSTQICHGADTSAAGARHTEIYDNTFHFHSSGTWTLHDINGNPVSGTYPLNINRWSDIRGGTGVITGNTMDNLLSQQWGQKVSVTLHIEQIDRNAGPDACCPEGYACFHQIGRGQNNGLEAMYIWGNLGTAEAGPTPPESPSVENSGSNQCAGNVNENNPGFYVALSRDYFTAAKPGWTRYTYPHPLTGTVTGAPAPPSSLKLTVQ